MRAFSIPTAIAAAAFAFQGAAAHNLSTCLSQSMDDAVGDWTLSYFIRNIGTGALTQGTHQRRTERPDDYTLIHHEDVGGDTYTVADVFDPEGFTRFDIEDDGARTEVFRVEITTCEGPDQGGYRTVVGLQRFQIGDQEYERRWDLLSSMFGIVVNHYARRADTEAEYAWQSFYGLTPYEANAEDLAMQ